MTRDAEELLTQWGKWVWQETGVPRCGSPMLAIVRDNVAMERCLSASISDDDAMLIDGIIARMGRRDEEMANCVRVYYATEMTMQQVGKVLNLNRLKVRELLIAGRCYVEAVLDMRERIAILDAA
ncbi:TPA: hypothetical protein VDU49_003263 [Pseudomonas aeruginosa]|uniref:antiterminator Q family protein n=1 Tax=Pseudomonas aeruginosa TaxID=287 RepID=UPI000FED682A|nr:antiterminator Q family protein [Pseudomonas aeruginosa]RPR90434.1 hypothetical protein IPC1033_31415 [Pseudomonas aeruginosa]HEP8750905.1 hypothetical protein [Pseudomonas aeruginosa]